jgi:hypothetical protein
VTLPQLFYILLSLNALVISLIAQLKVVEDVLLKQHVWLLTLMLLVQPPSMEQFVNGILMYAEIKIVKISLDLHTLHVKGREVVAQLEQMENVLKLRIVKILQSELLVFKVQMDHVYG